VPLNSRAAGAARVGCPLRQRCTTSKTGRVLSAHPQRALLAQARRAAADPAWKDEYRRWRPPVERAIAWLVARGSRRVPYRGITSNNAWPSRSAHEVPWLTASGILALVANQ
jgi:hypothetical protein